MFSSLIMSNVEVGERREAGREEGKDVTIAHKKA